MTSRAQFELDTVETLIGLHRLDLARDRYPRAFDQAREPADYEGLFHFIPRLFEGEPREDAWQALLAALPANCAALRLRLLLALGRHRLFLAGVERVLEAGEGGSQARALAAAAAALCDPGFPDPMRPKVFGIGLSRTGTTSLTTALEALGLAAIHWANPLTQELIGERDIHLFDAFADITVCHEFEAWYERFPNAQFLYTQRPLPAWETSFRTYYEKAHGTGDFARLKALMEEPDAFHWGRRWRRIQWDLYFRFETLAEAYYAYDARVMRFFRDRPAHRFLEFSPFAGEGWPQLCGFLGRPVPDRPFPWDNAAPPGHRPERGQPPRSRPSGLGDGRRGEG